MSTNGFGAHRGSRKPLAPEDSPVPADWLYVPTWPSRPLPDGSVAITSWLVLGDGELAAELGSGAIGSVDNVLYAPVPAGSPFDVAAAYAMFNEARRLVAELTALPSAPKLYFLTRNAQPVVEGDRANPVHAVLWGLGRTLALEHPEIWGGVIDVDESLPAVLAARHVRTEASAGDGEDQVVYRSGTRHVPRLEPTPPTTSDGRVDQGWQPPRHRRHSHIGPYLIQQLADMGAGTIVAVSRNPGRQVERPWPAARFERHDTGRGGRRRHRREKP